MRSAKFLFAIFVLAGALIASDPGLAQTLPGGSNDDSSKLPSWAACVTAAVAAPTCSSGCTAQYNQCKKDYPSKQDCCQNAQVLCQGNCDMQSVGSSP